MKITKIVILTLVACLMLPGLVLATNTGYVSANSDRGDNEDNHQHNVPTSLTLNQTPGTIKTIHSQNDNEDKNEADNENDKLGDDDVGNHENNSDNHILPTSKPTLIPTNNAGAPVTYNYDAKIAALEKQLAEQQQELARQGSILDQIMAFLKNIFQWK